MEQNLTLVDAPKAIRHVLEGRQLSIPRLREASFEDPPEDRGIGGHNSLGFEPHRRKRIAMVILEVVFNRTLRVTSSVA